MSKITLTVYADVVEPLAQWLATGGKAGSCPEWYRFIQFARTLNCSVFEVEALFREIGAEQEPAPTQIWLNRCVTAEAAESLAQQVVMNRAALSMPR